MEKKRAIFCPPANKPNFFSFSSLTFKDPFSSVRALSRKRGQKKNRCKVKKGKRALLLKKQLHERTKEAREEERPNFCDLLFIAHASERRDRTEPGHQRDVHSRTRTKFANKKERGRRESGMRQLLIHTIAKTNLGPASHLLFSAR